MTAKFGIEIEFVGLGRDTVRVANSLAMPDVAIIGEGYNHATRNHWKVVTDGSVSDGAELVSPPLAFNEASLSEVRKVFAKLNERRCSVNNSCGLHVHVDATFIRNYTGRNQERFFEFLVRAYQDNEDVFDRLVKSHRNTNSYCKSTKGKTWRNIRDDRYHKLNLDAFLRHGTIEFRHFQGTMNGESVVNWITLCVTFMKNVREKFDSFLASEAAARSATRASV